MEIGLIFAAVVAALLFGAWLLGRHLERRRGETPQTKAPNQPDAQEHVRADEADQAPKSTRPRALVPDSPLDLREIPSVRTRVKGTAYYVRDSQRRNLGALHYYLVRDPTNAHDTQAIKVLTPRGRHVGFVAAKRAASMSPLLDALDAEGFIVAGAAATEHSSALWVDLPSIPELRKYVKTLE